MNVSWTIAHGPIVAIAFAALTACGTTSSLESDGQPVSIDLTPYTRLLVEDFKDEATPNARPEAQPLLKSRLDGAVKRFPDQIADVVRSGGGFELVERSGEPAARTLVLSGAITQYDEGDPALALVVGFTAGNTNFDATLQLADGADGRILGTWTVHRYSWQPGLGFAALGNNPTELSIVSPAEFMKNAASKIGEELSVKRKAGSIVPPK